MFENVDTQKLHLSNTVSLSKKSITFLLVSKMIIKLKPLGKKILKIKVRSYCNEPTDFLDKEVPKVDLIIFA